MSSDAPIAGPASMLLDIHSSFRRASRYLRLESQRPEPDWSLVRHTFTRLAEVLHHHHHAEEAILFPRLVAAGVPAEELLVDHQALVHAIEQVSYALHSMHDVPTELARFDTLLVEHLDAEEAVAIPYLVDHPWF